MDKLDWVYKMANPSPTIEPTRKSALLGSRFSAAGLHCNQLRKGTEVQHIAHLLGVASIPLTQSKPPISLPGCATSFASRRRTSCY